MNFFLNQDSKLEQFRNLNLFPATFQLGGKGKKQVSIGKRKGGVQFLMSLL